ncbi:hypothetical protein VD0002_g5173 [Verticillium dahliae]|uniref:Metallo-beta-lactamase domain-containing protein n=2 Tax=Verticillium dahliae TaxID=27337 RepID=G2X1J0_VERDV|nr:uncharacterized protein VDAG_03601 [Verticillium dahliae VdLs.17]KAF3343671.1 hypothetical protein VdG2_07729 [Verticillium dahliae VDG2]KAH6704548.1 hypothetical protein EV126DRAFT_414453 [Verticillium dahliae]EGY22163.1 hypothetical protein VDAG_03601 [Verticillium dahliae VdLs.17]PNH33423.1 hypothetical protein BJF96_g3303 [Verticillium dahliae]PNH50451.1 hypothetical protein VD0003_g6726 [Verticillium dahliae]
MEANRPNADTFNITDKTQWRAALQSARPVLIHLNADTTWLLQLPYPEGQTPPPGRSRFNLLIDPWLRGSQCDVASWFSRQWHVIASSVQTTDELDSLVASVKRPDDDAGDEGGGGGGGKGRPGTFIDAVAISHEFTDHCHQETLLELPSSVPIIATTKAAKMVRAWGHFDTVTTTPHFSRDSKAWQDASRPPGLPSWLGISRIVTESNPLYFHSALMVTFETDAAGASGPEAVIYTPHGLQASDLASVKAAGVRTLALLHGLHSITLGSVRQLNLGALNGIRAVGESGARYWVATHDEVKRGKGLVAPLLKREQLTLQDAVEAEKQRLRGAEPACRFEDLGSGDALLLE